MKSVRFRLEGAIGYTRAPPHRARTSGVLDGRGAAQRKRLQSQVYSSPCQHPGGLLTGDRHVRRFPTRARSSRSRPQTRLQRWNARAATSAAACDRRADDGGSSRPRDRGRRCRTTSGAIVPAPARSAAYSCRPSAVTGGGAIPLTTALYFTPSCRSSEGRQQARHRGRARKIENITARAVSARKPAPSILNPTPSRARSRRQAGRSRPKPHAGR